MANSLPPANQVFWNLAAPTGAGGGLPRASPEAKSGQRQGFTNSQLTVMCFSLAAEWGGEVLYLRAAADEACCLLLQHAISPFAMSPAAFDFNEDLKFKYFKF